MTCLLSGERSLPFGLLVLYLYCYVHSLINCDKCTREDVKLNECFLFFTVYICRFFKKTCVGICVGTTYFVSHIMRKPVFGVSHQILHRPGCTTTEDGLRLEILDLRSIGIILSM